MEHRADAARRRSAADDVLHHIDHEPCFFRRQHGGALRRRRPEHITLLIFNTCDGYRRGARTERGEGGVGRDQFDGVDRRGADVDRRIGRDGRR